MEIEIECHTTLNGAVGEKNVSRGFAPVVIDGESLSEPGPESRTPGASTTTALPAGVTGGSMPIARGFK